MTPTATAQSVRDLYKESQPGPSRPNDSIEREVKFAPSLLARALYFDCFMLSAACMRLEVPFTRSGLWAR